MVFVMSEDLSSTPNFGFDPDRFIVCQNCGLTFVWTGWEQTSGKGRPEHCPGCHHVLALTRRQRGTVKWYNARKGFGFITAADGSELFVHRRALGRLKSLRRGDVVAFRVEQGQVGPQAVAVERLSAGKRRKRSSGRKRE